MKKTTNHGQGEQPGAQARSFAGESSSTFVNNVVSSPTELVGWKILTLEVFKKGYFGEDDEWRPGVLRLSLIEHQGDGVSFWRPFCNERILTEALWGVCLSDPTTQSAD